MIIRFFRNNNASFFIILPILAMLLSISSFFIPKEISQQYNSPLFGFFTNWLINKPILSGFFAFCLILLISLFLNYLANENEITSKRSFLPALSYILFMSCHIDLQRISPVLFSTFFTLLGLYFLLGSYRKDKAFANVFNAGFFFGTAFFIYLPCIFYLPLLWFSIGLLRPFIWREWIIALIGVMMPFIFLSSYFFFTDGLLWFLNHLKNGIHFSAIQFKPIITLSYLPISILLLLFIWSMFRSLNSNVSSGQKTQKSGSILFLLFIFSLPVLFLENEIAPFLALLAIPFSIFYSRFLLSLKKLKWAEIMFFILLVSIVVQQVYNFL